MFKEILKRCALGAVFGIALSQVIAIFISLCIADGSFYAVVPSLAERINSEIGAAIIQTVCSILYGAMFGGMSIIWELDNWSILKQTVVHFLVVSVVTMPIAYITEWMNHSALGVIIYFAIFAVIYAFIWFGQYMAIKTRINEVNKKVKEIA
ncbi:MAG: DUF3021 domain-containing protein [Ruminococcus sp.]|nr:DUF3021 domain-containing protein [Ruminococcus sp.]